MRLRHQRGFTLMEILVAMTLLATVGTVIMGSFQQSFAIRDHTAAIFDRYKDVRMAMHRMSREISMAYLSTHHRAEEPKSSTWFAGERDEMQFTSFANLRMVADSDESDQAEIGYYLKRGKTLDGRRVTNLMRRIDATPDEEALKGGFELVMVEDVKDIQFEYWEPDTEIAGDAWTDEWEAGKNVEEEGENGMILPDRVRITLTVNGVNGRPLQFVTQSTIMVRDALSF